jgi:hypothetical protein
MFSNTLSDYTFNQSARFGNDQVDQSQRTLQNTKYLSSVLFQYTPDKSDRGHLNFATQYPGMMVSGTNGGLGLGGESVEHESNLLWKSDPQRPYENLSLQTRPFMTVPYLGRGSCDPTIESQLLQGETVRGKKSVSTVMEQNFSPLDQYPMEAKRKANASNTIEELALNGWNRGGQSTRNSEEQNFSKKSQPMVSGY